MMQRRLHNAVCRHGQPNATSMRARCSTLTHPHRHPPAHHQPTVDPPGFHELCTFFDPSKPTRLHQVRDDNWWRQNAAKALAISAEMKKTPGRSRSGTGTPARSRSRSGTPAHSRSATTRRGGVAPRDARGTPSSRSGSVVGRAKGRNGGSGGSRSREDAGGWSTEDGAEGGVAGVGESRCFARAWYLGDFFCGGLLCCPHKCYGFGCGSYCCCMSSLPLLVTGVLAYVFVRS